MPWTNGSRPKKKRPLQNRRAERAWRLGVKQQLVSDNLWTAIAALLPPEPPKVTGGRPRVSDRDCLTGILFVIKSGVPWQSLPGELGCGADMTCLRRLRAWQVSGVWDHLQTAIQARLGASEAMDWSRVDQDSASLPAKRRRGRACS